LPKGKTLTPDTTGILPSQQKIAQTGLLAGFCTIFFDTVMDDRGVRLALSLAGEAQSVMPRLMEGLLIMEMERNRKVQLQRLLTMTL